MILSILLVIIFLTFNGYDLNPFLTLKKYMFASTLKVKKKEISYVIYVDWTQDCYLAKVIVIYLQEKDFSIQYNKVAWLFMQKIKILCC